LAVKLVNIQKGSYSKAACIKAMTGIAGKLGAEYGPTFPAVNTNQKTKYD